MEKEIQRKSQMSTKGVCYSLTGGIMKTLRNKQYLRQIFKEKSEFVKWIREEMRKQKVAEMRI